MEFGPGVVKPATCGAVGHHRLVAFCFAVLAISTVHLPVWAQEVPSDTLLTVDHFLDMERVGSPQISPDGSQIVFTRSRVDKMADRWQSELWIMNADGSRKRFLTKGSGPRWSPDGTRIAYLAPADPGEAQIFVRWMDAEGATSQITRVEESPTGIAWSPDGNSLGFVMLVSQKETWDISMPEPPQGATWTEAPRMVTMRNFRQDRMGFIKEGFTHLFSVPADGGTPRQITHGDWNVGARFSGITFGTSIAWTPDGQSIVIDGLMAEATPDRYGETYLYAVDVAAGDVSQLTARKGNWTGPTVSPDGRLVAFAGYDALEQTYHVSDLYVVGIDGRDMRRITPDLDRDVGSLFWGKDSRGVYFTAGDRGTQNVHYASTDGAVHAVTEGTHMLALSSVSDGGTAVGTLASPHEPGDVVRFNLDDGNISQVTQVNADLLTNKRLGEVEEIWYTATDDTRVQGWIVKPPNFDPSKEYPLILNIHGGPHGMYNVAFSYPYQNYAANGYVVLYTNPRGSTGYGTDFGNAIDDGYPSVDHDDLMAGVDSLIGRGYIDEDRLFVTGCSGGGVLSSWAIGHTNRFAAAAVRCPVINWISFAGTADIIDWGYHRFNGYFWDNPAKWLEHSPLMHVNKVQTPTLLMTGVLDLRTPMSQTEEYYAALKTLGVPAVMLRFNQEFHGTSSMPSNFLRTQLYIMSWFTKWAEEPRPML
ncbi:MAG: S9 family peptidase [Gemmatimonadetes bacterium]|nr:S9 family peptidase [Gemmatimonadota bacterium]